jgi:hypothetical protein
MVALDLVRLFVELLVAIVAVRLVAMFAAPPLIRKGAIAAVAGKDAEVRRAFLAEVLVAILRPLPGLAVEIVESVASVAPEELRRTEMRLHLSPVTMPIR